MTSEEVHTLKAFINNKSVKQIPYQKGFLRKMRLVTDTDDTYDLIFKIGYKRAPIACPKYRLYMITKDNQVVYQDAKCSLANSISDEDLDDLYGGEENFRMICREHYEKVLSKQFVRSMWAIFTTIDWSCFKKRPNYINLELMNRWVYRQARERLGEMDWKYADTYEYFPSLLLDLDQIIMWITDPNMFLEVYLSNIEKAIIDQTDPEIPIQNGLELFNIGLDIYNGYKVIQMTFPVTHKWLEMERDSLYEFYSKLANGQYTITYMDRRNNLHTWTGEKGDFLPYYPDEREFNLGLHFPLDLTPPEDQWFNCSDQFEAVPVLHIQKIEHKGKILFQR